MAVSRHGRVLALDYGKRRIGLAISDELGITAQGLPTFQRTRIRDDIQGIAELAASRGVELFLMGDPLHMSGRPSRGSAAVREFAERLGSYTGKPVEFWDERLTTVEANRVLKEGGASLERSRQAIDRLSAVILLSSYLDWRGGQAGGDEESDGEDEAR